MDYYEINVSSSSKEFKWAQQMLKDTIANYHTHNPSNHKVTFSNLELTRLVRVQNPALWLRFFLFFFFFFSFLKGFNPKNKIK